MQRAVAVHLHPGLLHQVEQVLLHLQAAHPVQQHIHAYASLRALGQQFRHLAADIAGPVDVGFEIDGLLCGSNGLQHGREDFRTILQISHLIARHNRRPQQHAHLAAELGIGNGVAVRQLALELLLGRGEIQRQKPRKQGHKDGDENDPEHFAFFPHG